MIYWYYEFILHKGDDAMTIEEMKELKKERGYTYEQIAELSGVPLGTVQKIFCGETRNPRFSTLQALEAVFQRPESVSYRYTDREYRPGRVEEPAPAYHVSRRQGYYTTEDYYALPDDRRVELIDGVFYDMSAPGFVHQGVAGEIYYQIASFIRKRKGECVVRMAPVDVRLNCDNGTMVQPDVMIVCDRSKIKQWGIMGAPDFIVEVLSPSTRKKDSFKKLDKYMEAGVREYWMVDPKGKRLIIYDFESELYPVVCGLSGKVPVGIYRGELEIDLDMVAETIEDYPNDGRDDWEE